MCPMACGSLPLQVIPQLSGDATEQSPPDLPSYLFKERIVYLVSATAAPVPARALNLLMPAVDCLLFRRGCRWCLP